MKSISCLCAGILACLGLTLHAAASTAPRHVTVYANADEFAGWPANEGLWAWGSEILVAAWVSEYQEDGATHNHAPNKPIRIQFLRSLDGGISWAKENHPEILPPEYLNHLSPPPGGIDFSNPDLAMRWRGSSFFVSKDRGHHWEGPYAIPLYPDTAFSAARSSYIPIDKDSCIILNNYEYISANGTYERAAAVKTNDGGKSFEFLSWIGPALGGSFTHEDLRKKNIYSTMPQGVKIGKDHYIVSLRSRTTNADRSINEKWADIYESTDGGRTWNKLSELERNSVNPISLTHLGGQTLIAAYGDRGTKPIGIYAKISRNLGRSWSKPVALRADAREWDIGYAISALRPDGKIVTVYYYTTETHPQNFIAATIWDPVSTFEGITVSE